MIFSRKKSKISKNKVIGKVDNDAIGMDIFICGDYNPIMEAIIGEKIEKHGEYQNVSLEKNYDPKLGITDVNLRVYQTKIDEDNKLNNINENLLENDKTFIYNSCGKNKNLLLDSFKSHKYEIIENNDFNIENPVFKWSLYFYCKNGFDKKSINEIKENIYKDDFDYNIKNTLISFVNNISEIYDVIDIFQKINKDDQPLYLFIIKNGYKNDKIIENLKKYVNEKQSLFNIRNVSILNEPYLNEEGLINREDNKNDLNSYILQIYLHLIKAWFYYNNIGDDFNFNKIMKEDNFIQDLLGEINENNVLIKNNKNKGSGYLNILLLGRPGVGKSTLVNLLSNSKRSMEGKGAAVTKKILRYIIKEFNICLYDSPGFELDKDVDNIKNLIEDLNNHLMKAKNQIHIVFYLINSLGARDFYDSERNILNILLKNQIPIFFLLTFTPNLIKGNQFKEVIIKNLRRIFKKIDPIHGLIYFEKKVKIFPVHLLDELEEEDIPCKQFGIRTVLEEAYKLFENFKINKNDIDQIINLLNKNYEKSIDNDSDNINKNENKIIYKEDIFRILNKNDNILYKHIKELNDVIVDATKNSEWVVTKYTIFSGFCFLGFITTGILKCIKQKIIEELAENFKIAKNDEEKKQIVKEHEEKINENNLETNIPIISLLSSPINVNNFGIFYMNKFINDLKEEGIEGLSKHLIDLINSYNKAIDGLEEISKMFNA